LAGEDFRGDERMSKNIIILVLALLLILLNLICQDFKADAKAAQERLIHFKKMAVANGSAEYQEKREFKWIRRR